MTLNANDIPKLQEVMRSLWKTRADIQADLLTAKAKQKQAKAILDQVDLEIDQIGERNNSLLQDLIDINNAIKD